MRGNSPFDHTFGVDRSALKDVAFITIAGKSFPLVGYEITFETSEVGRIKAEAVMVPNYTPPRDALIQMNKAMESVDPSEAIRAIIGDTMGMGDFQRNEDKSLSEQYNDLELDDARQTLVKHGLMESNGKLTHAGVDFLLNYLAREHEEDLADAVEEVEEAKNKKKEDKE